MTIAEIQKILETSFKNGFYIRRPFFEGYELYINKDAEVWHITPDSTVKIDLMRFENTSTDWEIVP